MATYQAQGLVVKYQNLLDLQSEWDTPSSP
jgi:hypothetical protein